MLTPHEQARFKAPLVCPVLLFFDLSKFLVALPVAPSADTRTRMVSSANNRGIDIMWVKQ